MSDSLRRHELDFADDQNLTDDDEDEDDDEEVTGFFVFNYIIMHMD